MKRLLLALLLWPAGAGAWAIEPDCADWFMYRCVPTGSLWNTPWCAQANPPKQEGVLYFSCRSWPVGKVWGPLWTCPDTTARRSNTTLRTTITCNSGACAGMTLTILPRPT